MYGDLINILDFFSDKKSYKTPELYEKAMEARQKSYTKWDESWFGEPQTAKNIAKAHLLETDWQAYEFYMSAGLLVGTLGMVLICAIPLIG